MRPTPPPSRDADVARMEAAYGEPRDVRLDVPMHEREFHLLRYSKRDGRYRDVTILIPYEGQLVCIAKHAYPPGVARPPSGGVVPGEAFDAAAEREALEETGLHVRVRAYLVRVTCTFTLDPRDTPTVDVLAEASGPAGDTYRRAIDAHAAAHPVKPGAREYWESHVVWADVVGGTLAPWDTHEIRHVTLLTARDLEERVHPVMRESGVGGFRYRVALQEAALAEARARGYADALD